MQYVLYVDGLWAYPQRDMFNDLGWETFSGPWPTSGTSGPTGFSTRRTSEWPNEGEGYSVCSLAAILEPVVAPKYYLSPRACAGILRRAERRGRTLPEALQLALATMAALAPEATEVVT